MKGSTKLFSHILKVYNYLRSNQRETSFKNICLFSLHKFKRSLICDLEEVETILNQINKMEFIYNDLLNKKYKRITVNKMIVQSIFNPGGSLYYPGAEQHIKQFLNSKK